MRNVFHQINGWFAVLDRYLLKEFAVNLIAVTGVFWLIFVATRFARYLSQAAAGSLPVEVVFELLGYSSLGAMAILLPIGTFLAVMLALGRLSSDSEMTVMQACGISRWRLIRNVMLFAMTMGAVVAVLSLWVVPEMYEKRYQTEQQAKLAANTTGLIAGSFKESHAGDWTFYSEGMSADKKHLQNIFIEIHSALRPLIFRAASGHFEVDVQTGDKFLILNNGYRYEGAAGDRDFVIAQFGSHRLLVEKGERHIVFRRMKSTSTGELLASNKPSDIAEVQWRISTALMTVLLALLAIPLANVRPRQGRYAGFVPAVIIYIIYSNLLGMSKAWVAKQHVLPWLGGIAVHILMILVLLLLFNRDRLRHMLHIRLARKIAS